MLPIRLDNVSLFNIAENAVYPLVVRVVGIKLDRAGWSIQANTEERTGEGAGNGVATCLLDGQLSTFGIHNGVADRFHFRMKSLCGYEEGNNFDQHQLD